MSGNVTSLSLRTVLTQVRDLLVGDGLKMSPALFSAQATPKSLLDSSFALDLQSVDTGLYREGWEQTVRMAHVLKVSIAKQVKPLDQFTSLVDAVDIEERVIKLVQNAGMFDRIHWTDTKRSPTPSREYLILDISFHLEHDWSFAP
jgi:hypothetical protein